ncbi:Undecaprenyl-phosphate glucose phosphotransferase [Pontibacter lucknowensis]|uniref:Undecaprenyl-phosphate glucose phosphotransferase n=2 Tax=Pontibacter lucknowensis TaxID=1077936 RepID=A0A1N7AZ20_9BACT|nr:Undecaprenyl-phosphate glucose phosphotransferase [Pontibacter lucknowensis]
MFTIVLISCFALYFINDKEYQQTAWIVLIGTVFTWTLISYWIRLQESELYNRINLRVVNYIKIYILLIGFVIAFYTFLPFSVETKNIVAAIVLGFPILGIPVNLLVVNTIDHLRSSNSNTKYTLVAGVGDMAGTVEKHLLRHNGSHVKLKGFIKCKKEECIVGEDRVVGDLDHINDYLRNNPVDEIVIAIPVKVSKKIQSIITAADYHGVRVKYIPDYRGLFGENYKVTRYGELDAINVRQLPLDETYAFFLKNTFDKVFSAFALLALSPLIVVLAILIKLDSPGPVFYCPIRIGKGGRPFKVFKFRSMRENDASTGGTKSTQKDDPRITKLGRILRKYSLDELPQFMNVLLGDMSVVGPRPHRSFLNQKLQESVDKYMIRHYFKPGITGWAQVNGWRGPTETDEQRKQRTMHDLWYMEKWSLWLDIRIIYKTIFSRKTHKSAY